MRKGVHVIWDSASGDAIEKSHWSLLIEWVSGVSVLLENAILSFDRGSCQQWRFAREARCLAATPFAFIVFRTAWVFAHGNGLVERPLSSTVDVEECQEGRGYYEILQLFHPRDALG
ncbi:hypothetical protein TNCT_109151 [Trichonephila clavata]|uniref:Uncharacterized protein n=1 Tax=Trichonephila clavata TaxID=2740835 RepID=A0A8X6GG92_TRICU|nr:hypothetical protein TNCT_109151 [Trichonephila clavata]